MIMTIVKVLYLTALITIGLAALSVWAKLDPFGRLDEAPAWVRQWTDRGGRELPLRTPDFPPLLPPPASRPVPLSFLAAWVRKVACFLAVEVTGPIALIPLAGKLLILQSNAVNLALVTLWPLICGCLAPVFLARGQSVWIAIVLAAAVTGVGLAWQIFVLRRVERHVNDG
jgi:hypothetical protein